MNDVVAIVFGIGLGYILHPVISLLIDKLKSLISK